MPNVFPNGLQKHVLWDMDGRQWIEILQPGQEEKRTFQYALNKGWAKIIPSEKLQELILSL